MPFVKGQIANPRGKPKGGKGGPGRSPDWLKQRCQDAVVKADLIGFLVKVANGEDIDQVINPNGECLKIPAGIKERIKATEILMDRGFGKVVQPIGSEEGKAGRFLVFCETKDVQPGS